MNWYVTLLNRSLNKLTGRRRLQLDKEHFRYFFHLLEPDQPRKVCYRPLNQSTSERSVAWQPITKKTNTPKPYWLHRAVSLKFHYVGANQWCFSIRPELRVTKDGVVSLDSDEIGRRVTKQKSRMYNYDLLSEVNFWRDYLSDGKSKIVFPFSKTQQIVISTSMMESQVEWLGIPEEYLKPFKNVHYEDDPLLRDEDDEEDFDDWDEQSEFDDDVATDDSIPF